jgi:hypothetical protein
MRRGAFGPGVGKLSVEWGRRLANGCIIGANES